MLRNILGDCTSYNVEISVLDSDVQQKIKELYDLDENTEVVLTESEIEKFNIPENAIDYDSGYFDKDELEYILEDLIGIFPYYLVLAKNCTWNGESGYKFCDNIIKTCERNYDISLMLKEIGKNAIKCIESSHDAPTGSETIIVGLSNEEYDELSESDFITVTNFAESKF